MDINATAALMVVLIGILLLLGYLGTAGGTQWATIQSNVTPFIVIIAIAIFSIALALRRD